MPEKFQSTHPLRGATAAAGTGGDGGGDFNPRTPCGVRRRWTWAKSPTQNFNPRTPCGVRPHLFGIVVFDFPNFNPRTPCGVRRKKPAFSPSATDFNPRTPCGVRPAYDSHLSNCRRISIHAPLAGCDKETVAYILREGLISIHAPLAGCDSMRQRASAAMSFQSTHPLRGATRRRHGAVCAILISIHAPLAGCDCLRRAASANAIYFNPRTPCGVRPFRGSIRSKFTQISIHAPLAGCDVRGLRPAVQLHISIHAPLAGCDVSALHLAPPARNFNPRTPCGVRLYNFERVNPRSDFNPRTPCGVRRQNGTKKQILLRLFCRFCLYCSAEAFCYNQLFLYYTFTTARSGQNRCER